jgi:hypothetical protein
MLIYWFIYTYDATIQLATCMTPHQTTQHKQEKEKENRSASAFSCSRQRWDSWLFPSLWFGHAFKPKGLHLANAYIAWWSRARSRQMASIFILFFSLWFGYGYKSKSSLISTKIHALDSAIAVQIKELASSYLKLSSLVRPSWYKPRSMFA